MSGDALEQLHLINSWKWQWGYSSTQPPLYSWLFKLFIQFCDFLGLNFRFTDSLFRQCLITISPLIGYLILRHYKVNQRDAALSSAGIFLLSDFAWDIQDTFTHSTIAIVTLYWFMFEFIKFLSCPTSYRHVLVGITIACVGLSKYNALFPVAGVLFAALSLPSARKIILRPKFLIVPFVTFLITAPHIHYLFSVSIQNTLKDFNYLLNNDNMIIPSFVIQSGGVTYLLLVQILPMLITLLLTFRFRICWFTKLILARGDRQQVLFGRAFLITVLLYTVFMIVSDASNIIMRWVLPAPVLLTMALPLAALDTGKLDRYGKGIFVGSVIVTTLAFILMVARNIMGESWPLPS